MCKCDNLNNIIIENDFTLKSQTLTSEYHIDKKLQLEITYNCKLCNKEFKIIHDNFKL